MHTLVKHLAAPEGEMIPAHLFSPCPPGAATTRGTPVRNELLWMAATILVLGFAIAVVVNSAAG